MRPFRRFRVAAAFAVLLGLLFAQLAVAAHVCDALAAKQAAAMVDPGASHDCCGGNVQPDPSALCQAHCQPGEQVFEKTASPAPLALAAPVVLPVLVADAPPAQPPPRILPSLLTRPAEPSLALRHCCFRI